MGRDPRGPKRDDMLNLRRSSTARTEFPTWLRGTLEEAVALATGYPSEQMEIVRAGLHETEGGRSL